MKEFIYIVSWCIAFFTWSVEPQKYDEFGRRERPPLPTRELDCNYHQKLFIGRDSAIAFYNRVKAEEVSHEDAEWMLDKNITSWQDFQPITDVKLDSILFYYQLKQEE